MRYDLQRLEKFYSYFVNFAILVLQKGQMALNRALPLAVTSLLTSVSFTLTFFLHLTQNISVMYYYLKSSSFLLATILYLWLKNSKI